jgi:hypothetical protein
MTKRSNLSIQGGAALSLAFALTLAACGENERTYEPDATDVGEGELIVATPSPGAPDPELPETAMTPVPDDTAETDPSESTPAEPAAE